MSATVTVKRTGEVVADGVVAGRVEKRESESLFGYSRMQWIAYDADGAELGNGYDTRKRAADRVAQNAEPLRVTHVKRGTGWSGQEFASLIVSEAGTSFCVSRYATEDVWVVDALFQPGTMMPVFSNGDGSRVTRAYTLKDEYADAATKAAIEAGVWPLATPETKGL